jgi:TorA maturation chaperone TorD
MRLGVLREERQQMIGLSEVAIDSYKAASLDSIDATRQEAQARVAIGLMTQEELLKLDRDLEDKRYEVTKQAIQERLALMERDPTKNVIALAKLNAELEAEERAHMARVSAVNNQIQQEQLKDWQGLFSAIGTSFGNVVAGLVSRTMTWGQAVRSLFSSLLQSVANFLGQMVAKKVAAWATEKALSMAAFFGFDHVVWAGGAGLVDDKTTLEKAQKLSFYGWLLGSLCQLAADAAELRKLLAAREKARAAAGDAPGAAAAADAAAAPALHQRALAATGTAAQAALAAALLGLLPLKPRTIGLIGVTTSAIACYQLLPPLPKAEPPKAKDA